MDKKITNLRDLVKAYHNHRSDVEIANMLAIDIDIIQSIKTNVIQDSKGVVYHNSKKSLAKISKY